MLLYLHIPFCDSKCGYCSFNSYTNLNSLKISYMDTILTQFKEDAKRFKLKEKQISSFFIGGGTPSTIKAYMYKPFFDLIKPYLKEDAEITTEANPNSASKEWLSEMLLLGVNRLSFGVQSFDDKKLKFLNRSHKGGEAINAVKIASEIGYKNISIDLIYGVLGDTKKLLKNDINIASNLPINHLSAYSLTVEENTPFFSQKNVQNNSLSLAQFFVDELKRNDFMQYEISNFSKGFTCKHNLGYWQHKNYIGIGAGAVGYLKNQRFYPQNDVKKYIENPLLHVKEDLSKNDLILEKIFLGLRSKIGVDLKLLNEEKVKDLLEDNKIFVKNKKLYNKDYFLSDEIALYLTS
ncbi:MAG: radical SAM family heme chaperone HemW [Campylobacteraceae bacterium]